MKCIKDENGKIFRVTDKQAEQAVAAGYAKYCPKHEYKEQNKKEKAA